MTSKGDVLIRFLGDSRSYDRAAGKVTKSTDKAGASAQKADSKFGAMGGTAVRFFAGTAVVAGIGAWANEAADLALAAEQVERSFDKTFGKQASAAIVSSLEDQRKALGLSEAELQKQLLSFGQLATATGQTREEAAEFSQTLFEMAGDVAAFNGETANSEQVLGAFGSALKGEFDALEQFGVKIKQSDVNMRAMADTGKDTADELTELEKQEATVALITDQLGDEFGALALAMANGETAGNELSAEMKDIQTDFGGVAQVAKTALMKAVLGIINGFKSLVRWVTLVSIAIRDMGAMSSAAFSKLNGFGRGIVTVFRGIGGAVSGALRQIGKIATAIGRLPRIPRFHQGGVMPGTGEGLAMLKGGERVQTKQQQRQDGGGGGGGGTNVTIHIDATLSDPQAIGQRIVDLLVLYNASNGPAPIEIQPA